MGFLNPTLLLLGAAAAVPVLLHLVRQARGRRIPFPAIRYLKRAERDRARTIRLRQLLLLALRVATILLIALAASRPYLRVGAASHEATSLVVILDNSMSSGLVKGDRRLLDDLKELAQRTVQEATAQDRIWIVRAAEPWDLTLPMVPRDAAARVRDTRVVDAAANLSDALARAASLIVAAGLPTGEIHLLSDLQATGFPDGPMAPVPEDIPVVVAVLDEGPTRNHFLDRLEVGGGLPPRAGRPSDVSVQVRGVFVDGPGAEVAEAVSVRLYVAGRLRGSSIARVGGEVLLPLGPLPTGGVTGHVEADPDDLRADDSRYFSLEVQPPPRVATLGDVPVFMDEALSVFADAQRARVVDLAEADMVLVMGSPRAMLSESHVPIAVLPPLDPGPLPGLNRWLAIHGIPWRFEAPDGRGEARVRINRLGASLGDLRVFQHYGLVPTGPEADRAETWIELADGSPWMVRGTAGLRRYLLLGSPLHPSATNVPVEAAMIPLQEWMIGAWTLPGPSPRSFEAGEAIPLPRTATSVLDPSGISHAVSRAPTFSATGDAGVYTIFAGDSMVRGVAVNPPARESLLGAVPVEKLEEKVGAGIFLATDVSRWEDSIFRNRRGPELWKWALVAALYLAVVETWVSAATRAAQGTLFTGGPRRPIPMG